MSLLLLFGQPIAVSSGAIVWNPEWVPDFVFKQSYAFDTLITEGNLGPEYRRGKRAYSISTFDLNFAGITKALAASIYSFYIDSKGPFRPFDWANPVDGQTYAVRFLDDSIKKEEVGEDLINMQIKFRQVI